VWKEALKILGMVPCCFTAFIIVMLVVMYAGPMVPSGLLAGRKNTVTATDKFGSIIIRISN